MKPFLGVIYTFFVTSVKILYVDVSQKSTSRKIIKIENWKESNLLKLSSA
jgi:hypothetical protein